MCGHWTNAVVIDLLCTYWTNKKENWPNENAPCSSAAKSMLPGNEKCFMTSLADTKSLEFRSWLRPRAVSRLCARFARDKIIKSLRSEQVRFFLSFLERQNNSTTVKQKRGLWNYGWTSIKRPSSGVPPCGRKLKFGCSIEVRHKINFRRNITLFWNKLVMGRELAHNQSSPSISDCTFILNTSQKVSVSSAWLPLNRVDNNWVTLGSLSKGVMF